MDWKLFRKFLENSWKSLELMHFRFFEFYCLPKIFFFIVLSEKVLPSIRTSSPFSTNSLFSVSVQLYINRTGTDQCNQRRAYCDVIRSMSRCWWLSKTNAKLLTFSFKLVLCCVPSGMYSSTHEDSGIYKRFGLGPRFT